MLGYSSIFSSIEKQTKGASVLWWRIFCWPVSCHIICIAQPLLQHSHHQNITKSASSLLHISERKEGKEAGHKEQEAKRAMGKGKTNEKGEKRKEKQKEEAKEDDELQNMVSVEKVGDKTIVELVRPLKMENKNPYWALDLSNLPMVQIIAEEGEEEEEGKVIIPPGDELEETPSLPLLQHGKEKVIGRPAEQSGGRRGGTDGTKEEGTAGRGTGMAKGGGRGISSPLLSSSSSSTVPAAAATQQRRPLARAGSTTNDQIKMTVKMLREFQPKIDAVLSELTEALADRNKFMRAEGGEGLQAMLRRMHRSLEKFWTDDLRQIDPTAVKAFDPVEIYRSMFALQQHSIARHFALPDANEKLMKIYGQQRVCYRTCVSHSADAFIKTANKLAEKVKLFKNETKRNKHENQAKFTMDVQMFFDHVIRPELANILGIINLGLDSRIMSINCGDKFFLDNACLMFTNFHPEKRAQMEEVEGIFKEYFDTKGAYGNPLDPFDAMSRMFSTVGIPTENEMKKEEE